MNYFFLQKKWKAIFFIVSVIFLSLQNSKTFSQSYNSVAGVYQTYQNGEPVEVEGLNMFYIFNKKGLVFMAFGRSSGSAFSDVAEGISSGRIMTGDFKLSDNKLTMKMEKGTGNTYWKVNQANKSITNGSLKLVFIESL